MAFLCERKQLPEVPTILHGQSQLKAEHMQNFIRNVICSELNADCIPHFDGRLLGYFEVGLCTNAPAVWNTRWKSWPSEDPRHRICSDVAERHI